MQYALIKKTYFIYKCTLALPILKWHGSDRRFAGQLGMRMEFRVSIVFLTIISVELPLFLPMVTIDSSTEFIVQILLKVHPAPKTYSQAELNRK